MSTLKLLTPNKRLTERPAVLELARVLYIAHSKGWASLSLNTSHSRPSDHKFSGSVTASGGVQFEALAPVQGVKTQIRLLITEDMYRQAFNRLNTYHQGSIRAYFKRPASAYDSCPSLNVQDLSGEWQDTYRKDYALQYEAFKALYQELLVHVRRKAG